MRTALWVTAALAGLTAAGAGYTLLPGMRPDAHAAATEQRAGVASPVVMVTTARVESTRTVRQLSGTIAARSETELAFRVGGKMLDRTVSVGDPVRAGEVVATLDDTDLGLRLEAAEAERDAARIALDKAEINLARVSQLESNGWASGQASDIETVAVEEARARLLRAERNAELAANELGYASLRADADGVVTETMAEPGQVVGLGQPVVRVARAAGREAVVAVPEAMLDALDGAKATVELWSKPGIALPASLRELSPIADAATRTFEARYALEEGRKAAALGMSVTVTLASDGAGPAIELPLAALFDTGAGPLVWVVGADGRLTARPVTVAGYDGDRARIAAGIADGDRVVVLGAHKLEAGETVRPVEAEG